MSGAFDGGDDQGATQSGDADYIVDFSSAPHLTTAGSTEAAGARSGVDRAEVRFVNIHFECCSVYAAIYRNAAATAYCGHCPKCLRAVTIKIGAGGSTSRVFRAK
jgi:hypothetical protein